MIVDYTLTNDTKLNPHKWNWIKFSQMILDLIHTINADMNSKVKLTDDAESRSELPFAIW